MSYDIMFKCRLADLPDTFVTVYDPCANITWNLGEMIRESTGLEWLNEEDNGLVSEVMPAIERGWDELLHNPGKYEQYEADNGWGTINGCRSFFAGLMNEWCEFRRHDPQLAEVAHFWIE